MTTALHSSATATACYVMRRHVGGGITLGFITVDNNEISAGYEIHTKKKNTQTQFSVWAERMLHMLVHTVKSFPVTGPVWPRGWVEV